MDTLLQDEQKRYIVAALKPFKEDLPEPFDEGTKTYEFADNKKFWDYLTSDCISEIAEKCDALFIDTYEEQWLYPDKLPIAIEIVSKAIKQKKNASFVEYLEQIKIHVFQGVVFLTRLQDRVRAAAIMLLFKLPSCLCHPYLPVNGSLYSFTDFLS